MTEEVKVARKFIDEDHPEIEKPEFVQGIDPESVEVQAQEKLIMISCAWCGAVNQTKCWNSGRISAFCCFKCGKRNF